MPVIGHIDLSIIGISTNPDDLIRTLYNLGLAVAGLIFFAMLIFGGFRYLTAGGDEKAAASAQKTLTYAFVGIVIVVAAWVIFQLVVTIFNIKGVSAP